MRPTNNYTLLSVLAVILVIVRHAGILIGPDADTAVLADIPAIGLFILLAISGNNLGASWHRDPRLFRYTAMRLVRYLPGLYVVLLLTLCVLGPIMTDLGLHAYLTHPETGEYLNNFVLNPRFFLPGVFESNPESSAVNGSLWSLPAQLAVVFFVPLVALVKAKSLRVVIWFTLAAASGVASFTEWAFDAILWGNRLSDVFHIWPAFFVAAGLAAIRLRVRPVPGLVALGVVVLGILADDEILTPTALWTMIPVVVLWLAHQPVPALRGFARFGNPTFGIFLVGFPTIQMILALFGPDDGIIEVVATVVISVAFGYALWHLVEKPVQTKVRSLLAKRSDRFTPTGSRVDGATV